MTRRETPGAYLPLDVNFADNAKVAGLSDGAFRLHVCGLLYCKRLKVDGIISPAVVPKLTPKYRPAHLTQLLDRLLWVELNGSGHYAIHDWLDWNISGERAREIAAKRSEAARKRWED